MKYVLVVAFGARGGTDKLVGELEAESLTAAKVAYKSAVESGDLPDGLTVMDARIFEAIEASRATDPMNTKRTGSPGKNQISQNPPAFTGDLPSVALSGQPAELEGSPPLTEGQRA